MMASAVNLTSPSSQYLKLTAHQPLDFSAIPHGKREETRPSQEILDLCVRRASPPLVKVQHPVTILQQHLMQPTPLLRTRATPEYPPPGAMMPQAMQFHATAMLNTNNARAKPTRPFKAYPKDPLSLSVGVTSESLLGHSSNEAYSEFRRRMLDQVQAATAIGSNGNKSRSSLKRPASPDHPTSTDGFLTGGPLSSPEEARDAAYWERRRKNNEAAKRSRDARRAKEDEIAIRAAFLEQENMKLKYELEALRNETAKLRCMIYNS